MNLILRSLVILYRFLFYLPLLFSVIFLFVYFANGAGHDYASSNQRTTVALLAIISFYAFWFCLLSGLIRIFWKRMWFYMFDFIFLIAGSIVGLVMLSRWAGWLFD